MTVNNNDRHKQRMVRRQRAPAHDHLVSNFPLDNRHWREQPQRFSQTSVHVFELLDFGSGKICIAIAEILNYFLVDALLNLGMRRHAPAKALALGDGRGLALAFQRTIKTN